VYFIGWCAGWSGTLAGNGQVINWASCCVQV
jgi:hypothetical protein